MQTIGFKVGSQCRQCLLVHDCVGLTEVFAALRVTEDDELAEQVAKHFSGDLASVCTRRFEVHVLCTKRDVGVSLPPETLLQVW